MQGKILFVDKSGGASHILKSHLISQQEHVNHWIIDYTTSNVHNKQVD